MSGEGPNLQEAVVKHLADERQQPLAKETVVFELRLLARISGGESYPIVEAARWEEAIDALAGLHKLHREGKLKLQGE